MEWAKTFCNKWNATVKKVNPNATYFGYGDATFNEDSFTLEQAVKVDEAATKYIKATKTERLANALKKYQAKEQAGQPLVESFSKAAKERLIKSDTISEELKTKYLTCDPKSLNMAYHNITANQLLEAISRNGLAMKSFASNTKFFPSNVFPSGLTHTSVAEWANRKNVKTGDKRLVLHRGAFYRVEKFDDMDFKYLITKKFDAQDYNEELKEYGEIDSEEPVQERVDRIDALYRETDEHGQGRYYADSSGTEHRGEDLPILSVDQDTTEGREDYSRTERDRQGGLRDQRHTGRESLERTPQELYDKMEELDRKLVYATGRYATMLKNKRERYASMIDEMKGWDQVRFSDRDNAPTFYSQMAKVVDGVKQEKLGAASVVNMLRGKGVKAEEIKWSGIEEWLEGKKSVTKAELQDFIAGSMLQIEEKTRGSTDNVQKEFVQAWRNFIDQDLDESEILDGLNYVDTSLPYYLEDLVENEDLDQYYADYILDLAKRAGKHTGKPTKWDEYKLDGGENYRELVFKMPRATYTNMAMQGHWGVEAQGVLAHARMQDFDTADGKRMLFIEGIQSDWHNEGQKEGYRKEGEKTDSMLRKESQEAYKKFYSTVEDMIYSNAKWEDDNASYYAHPVVVAEMFEGNESHFDQYKFTEEQKETIRSMVAEETARQEAIKTAPKQSAVPDAPFQNTYHEYVMKRMLREAAEKGYDSIGWTLSDVQDERWKNGDAHAEGTGKSGFLKAYQNVYDKKIKGFMDNFGKKWGVRVGTTTLKNGTEVWSMAITDSMKESVLTEGQALYSDRDTESVSNRSLLANAFEGITQNSEEYKLIQEYKGRIKILNEYEEKLAKLNAEIQKVRFTKGEYDAKKLKELEAEAKNLNRQGRKLLSLEASEPLRKLIEQEHKKEAQKTIGHVKEIQQNKKVRAEQTELRHKIRKTVRDLDKILNRGNKKQNVKQDMKGFVSKALELADSLAEEEFTKMEETHKANEDEEKYMVS